METRARTMRGCLANKGPFGRARHLVAATSRHHLFGTGFSASRLVRAPAASYAARTPVFGRISSVVSLTGADPCAPAALGAAARPHG